MTGYPQPSYATELVHPRCRLLYHSASRNISHPVMGAVQPLRTAYPPYWHASSSFSECFPIHPACIALVKAMRLLYGLRLRSLCTGGSACTGGGAGLLFGTAGRSSKRFLAGPRPPFLASYGLRDRRAAAALRFENGLKLRSRLPRYGEGDLDGARFAGGDAPHLPLDAPLLGGMRSSDVSMGSGVLDRDLDTERRRPAGRFLSRLVLLLRDLTLPLILRSALPLAFSCGDFMRADLDLDFDLVLRRPRSPGGLKELIRRRVFLSSTDSCGERESMDTDRLLRLRSALSSCPRDFCPSCFRRRGDRDREGERFVEIVETESADDMESERARLRSSSFFFRISSATPFLRTRYSGTSVVSLGFSLGLRSCCVLDGRDLYGRSCVDALHS
jgi:hypothetical protein